MKRTAEVKNLISNMILAVLVAVSVFLAGAVAARYLTNGTGNDSARVAKWQVSAVVTPPSAEAELTTAPDGSSYTGNYEVAFTNGSEVAARASVIIEGMPSGMTAYARESASAPGTLIDSSTGWDISMNGGTTTVYIYFVADTNVNSDRYNITITPVFTQID